MQSTPTHDAQYRLNCISLFLTFSSAEPTIVQKTDTRLEPVIVCTTTKGMIRNPSCSFFVNDAFHEDEEDNEQQQQGERGNLL